MRTHYRDGTEIGLQANGCDGCEVVSINGVICHEHGCPFAPRDWPAPTVEDIAAEELRRARLADLGAKFESTNEEND